MTVTLPDATLERLRAMGKDRAKAIVKAVDAACGATDARVNDVEVVEIRKGVGYILVRSSATLSRIPGLQLVEVSPNRYLISIPTGTAVESLEVGILDLLDHVPASEERERRMLLHLRELVKKQRLASSVSKSEILFVGTRGGSGGRHTPSGNGQGGF